MYVKWTPKLRRHIIRQWQLGITPVTEIARNRRIPRRTIYYLIERYKSGGYEALEPKPKGRKKLELNPGFILVVKEEFNKHKIGSYKMWKE